MGNLLFIDSDDINGLSEALKEALERRGVVFNSDQYGEFGYSQYEDDDEPDIDPYLGVMPSHSPLKRHDENDRWLFQESGGSYGGCGYGGCGHSVSNRRGGCGSGGC
jgi:hypothetical protein